MINVLRQNLFAVLQSRMKSRLCRVAERLGKWRRGGKKKPEIIKAARTGCIRRVK